MAATQVRKVLVFRSEWLAASETFIRKQISSLERYSSTGFGLTLNDSPNRRAHDHSLFTGRWKRIRRLLFVVTRRSKTVERFIVTQRPNLVHAHFGSDGTLLEPMLTRLRVPLIVTFHGVDASQMLHERTLRNWLYKKRLKQLFRSETQIIAVSDHIADKLITFGAPVGRVSTAYIGVEPSADKPREHAYRSGVVFAGRLVAKKGVRTLIEAWKEVPPELRAMHKLEIVGTGPLEHDLREQASREIDDNSIIFTPWLNHDELGNRMAEAAVCVVPSETSPKGDTEGLPTVLLEAASHGAAIVATNHAGAPEFISNRVNGYLVPESSAPDLAAAISALLSNPQERDALGKSARLKSMNEFDLYKCTEYLEECYDNAVQGIAT